MTNKTLTEAYASAMDTAHIPAQYRKHDLVELYEFTQKTPQLAEVHVKIYNFPALGTCQEAQMWLCVALEGVGLKSRKRCLEGIALAIQAQKEYAEQWSYINDDRSYGCKMAMDKLFRRTNPKLNQFGIKESKWY